MKILLFSTPIDAGNYLAGAGLCKGVAIRSIDYETGTLRFSLVRENGDVLPEVNGIWSAAPGENTAAEEIRAVIAATLA